MKKIAFLVELEKFKTHIWGATHPDIKDPDKLTDEIKQIKTEETTDGEITTEEEDTSDEETSDDKETTDEEKKIDEEEKFNEEENFDEETPKSKRKSNAINNHFANFEHGHPKNCMRFCL